MPIVDIHTHIYPPAFVSLLKSRKEVPYIRTFPDAPDNERLIILPGEDDPSMPSTARGRPFTSDYSHISKKIEFMDRHDIDVSVISLANPWLDFLSSEEAPDMARKVNDNMNDICSWVPGRFYAFGTLPLTAPAAAVVDEIVRLANMPNIKGVIMGTSGLGKGLDDPELEPIYAALEKTGTLIFLHPHYGLPAQVYGPAAANYGHILPLALGFPLETTIAVSRMILSGVFDRYPELKVLLAHSGGTLPFLAGRIESCIKHDAHFKKAGLLENRKDIWTILRTNIYLDAVIYSEVGLTSAVLASTHERMMFGTDHPFFPPLDDDNGPWRSVAENYAAILAAFQGDDDAANGVLGVNAQTILGLPKFPEKSFSSQKYAGFVSSGWQSNVTES